MVYWSLNWFSVAVGSSQMLGLADLVNFLYVKPARMGRGDGTGAVEGVWHTSGDPIMHNDCSSIHDISLLFAS